MLEHALSGILHLAQKNVHILKPTLTGLGMNWFDGSPINYKLDSIKTQLNRAYNLTSNYF